MPTEDELNGIREQLQALKGWPLDKRETFSALVLMGLASRLQPVATGKQEDKERIVALAFELGAMACATADAAEAPAKKSR